MPVTVHLSRASLDDESQDESDTTSGLGNLLDSIKQSSQKNHHNQLSKKRVPIDPSEQRGSGSTRSLKKAPNLTFQTVTESLSASSEEITEAIGRTFGLVARAPHDDSRQDGSALRSKNAGNRTSSGGELVGTSAWTTFPKTPAFRQTQSPLHDTMDDRSVLSPSRRTARILKEIATNATESEDSDDESASWIEGTPNGSREFSLLDNEEENEGEDDAGTIHSDETPFDTDGDEDSVFTGYSSLRTTGSYLDDDELHLLEDGLAAIGGAMYKLGTCTFRDPNVDFDDDYTAASGMFPPPVLRKQSRGRSRSPRTPPAAIYQTGGNNTNSEFFNRARSRSDRDRTPQGNKGFFQSIFNSCGGPLP